MINLFSAADFEQLRDLNNSLYILINRTTKERTQLIERMGQYLLANHQLIFEADT